MKKIIQPKINEKSEYFSDLSDKPFYELPPITINCEFNYGSKLDGTVVELHFTDEEFLRIVSKVKNMLSTNSSEKINLLLSQLIN